MYEIQKDQSVPVKFFAGEYPVVTAVKAVAAGKSVKQYEPVKLTDNGIEPVVKVAASEAVSGTSTPAKSEYENTTAGIYGIAATAADTCRTFAAYYPKCHLRLHTGYRTSASRLCGLASCRNCTWRILRQPIDDQYS